MKITELKNYGKSLPQCTRGISGKTMKQIRKIAMRIVRKRIGVLKLLKLPFHIIRERKKFLSTDLKAVRKKIKDERFIDEMIQEAALFAALKSLVGPQEAMDIHYRILDATQNLIMDEILPSPGEIMAFRDPYLVIKDYFLSMMKADSKEHYHVFKLAEDRKNAFQANITYCAWYEIKKAFGIPEATLPNCYSDDVFLPSLTAKFGVRFVRKGTIANGSRYCDFRFEKL